MAIVKGNLMLQKIISTISTFSALARSKLTLIGIVVLLTAGGMFALSYHRMGVKIETLQVEKGKLQENSEALKAQIEGLQARIAILTTANDTNLETIRKLTAERADAAAAIAALAATTANNKKVIAQLNERLRQLLADPKNDGVVAPALRETVRDVQNARK